MRRTAIVTGGIYHLCNRAVEGRKIFTDGKDCQYFLESILLANGTGEKRLYLLRPLLRKRKFDELDLRQPLLHIYAFILMPDHFHILGKQLVDNGISLLIQRVCDSYGKYYNQKYSRRGSLFLGPYKSVSVDTDVQAAHLFTYIHGNVLDMVEPRWREGEIVGWTKARQLLEEYPWSSFGTYTKRVVDPVMQRIINKSFAENYYESRISYLTAIKDWSRRNEIKGLSMEDVER